MLWVVPFLNHAVHGRPSSGQVPGRFRCTIFHVHKASVTKHDEMMPKVPLRIGCGSQVNPVVTLPSAPATMSHPLDPLDVDIAAVL